MTGHHYIFGAIYTTCTRMVFETTATGNENILTEVLKFVRYSCNN